MKFCSWFPIAPSRLPAPTEWPSRSLMAMPSFAALRQEKSRLTREFAWIQILVSPEPASPATTSFVATILKHDSRVNVETCRRLGARSMVAVPLSARQSVIGLLEAFSSEAFGFNDSDVRSLNLLAELILAALKPEEEDRLAEISRRVVASVAKPAEKPVDTPPQSYHCQLQTSMRNTKKLTRRRRPKF